MGKRRESVGEEVACFVLRVPHSVLGESPISIPETMSAGVGRFGTGLSTIGAVRAHSPVQITEIKSRRRRKRILSGESVFASVIGRR